jgi:hypothetical protein
MVASKADPVTRPSKRDEDEQQDASLADRMPPALYGVAVLIVSAILAGAFAFMVIKVIEYADNPSEIIWGRRLFLYEGLFSLISAIVGALFATTVYRPQLRKARSDASSAQRVAQSNARAAGSAREHGRARAEQTRARILEHVALSAARRPRTFLLGPEDVEREEIAHAALRSALQSDEAVYFSRGVGDVPAPQLTIADVVEAVEASRLEDDDTPPT